MYVYIYATKYNQAIQKLLIRCNPDVAPRLTSGGYEDKVYVITNLNQHIVHKGWQIVL